MDAASANTLSRLETKISELSAPMNLFEVAREIANRLSRIFQRDQRGRRPVFGGTEKFQTDPLGGIICCSTNISMATMAPASAPATRPDGPGWWRR